MSEYKLSFAIVSNAQKTFELVRIESKIPWEILRETYPKRHIIMEAHYTSSIRALDDYKKYQEAVRKLNLGEINYSDLYQRFWKTPDELVFYAPIKN